MIVSLRDLNGPLTLALLFLATATRLSPAPNPPPAAGGTTRLTLRNGTVYLLKEPPRISGTRIVFTTLDGRVFMMDQSEIEGVGAAPRPTVTPKKYDTGDSRALGAIARQQRDRQGKRAAVAPRSAVRRPTRTPRPRVRPAPTPRPAPTSGASGKTSPG